ncbi:hypothetical protein CFP56_029935 [Quercus suber]|uniref:UBA domain-containing protein n=1 Tax=Quercus suber TaxID=58331 RepID=A0AAW0JQF6_QUESU
MQVYDCAIEVPRLITCLFGVKMKAVRVVHSVWDARITGPLMDKGSQKKLRIEQIAKLKEWGSDNPDIEARFQFRTPDPLSNAAFGGSPRSLFFHGTLKRTPIRHRRPFQPDKLRYEQRVQKLVEMGFAEVAVRSALKDVNGGEILAIKMLRFAEGAWAGNDTNTKLETARSYIFRCSNKI